MFWRWYSTATNSDARLAAMFAFSQKPMSIKIENEICRTNNISRTMTQSRKLLASLVQLTRAALNVRFQGILQVDLHGREQDDVTS